MPPPGETISKAQFAPNRARSPAMLCSTAASELQSRLKWVRNTRRQPACAVASRSSHAAALDKCPWRPDMRCFVLHGRERQYRSLFPAMIADWRRVWGRGDFPFLFVQIAPYRDLTPEIREAQLLSWQRTKNTAMVVTADCGDANDIHPTRKRPVGARLALAARALAYGEHIDYSGPVYESMEVDGDTAVLRFTHLGGGLVAQDGELRDFVIAGPDKVFHPARARIEGDTIRVHAPGVTQPAAVRYGWAKVPEGNLFNRAGLPASPFRTDVD